MTKACAGLPAELMADVEAAEGRSAQRGDLPAAAAGSLGDAFSGLRRLHLDRFRRGESLRGEQEGLEAQLEEARAELRR